MKIRSVLLALRLILEDLRTTSLNWLKPAMRLVGSLNEGSCLIPANELDVTLSFEALNDHPLKILHDNACQVVLPDDSVLGSKGFSIMGSKVLNYPKFYSFLLQSLSDSIAKMSKHTTWPAKLKCNLSWNFDQCSSCQLESNVNRTSVHSALTHCQNCHPTVCHTKIGPCVVFTYGIYRTPLAVDIVPVYPIVSPGQGMASLFKAAKETVERKKPENWNGHYKKLMTVERVLPEPGGIHQFVETRGIFHIPIKLLNYGPENNHIIRPGMNSNQVSNGFVYAYCKAVKKLLMVKVSSYAIKKVLSLEQVEQRLSCSKVLLDEALCIVLSHPELVDHFQLHIDFLSWASDIEKRKKNQNLAICQRIPLKLNK